MDVTIPIPATGIRLACRYCDRDDHDDILFWPYGWENIEEFQTYDESCSSGWGSCGEWWTHLGACPECSRPRR